MIGLAAFALALQSEMKPLLTFSTTPVLVSMTTEVTIGTYAAGADAREYWFRRQIRVRNRIVRTVWADTRDCPRAGKVIEDLKLAAPALRTFDLASVVDRSNIRDGSTYSLEVEPDAPFGIGGLKLQDVDTSSLAKWVDASLERLELCWLPQLNRKPEF